MLIIDGLCYKNKINKKITRMHLPMVNIFMQEAMIQLHLLYMN